MVRALVLLADGVEEMEAVIIIDTLRRAKWEVVSASVPTSGATADPLTVLPSNELPGRHEPSARAGESGAESVTGSRGVRLLADTKWRNVDPGSFNVLVLPGGSEGTHALSSDKRVLEIIRSFVRAQKPVAAICAAPLVLQSAGVLDGRKATCHPAVRQELTSARLQDDRVVIDGQIVTSQGPGTAFEFVLAIIRFVDGSDAANAVAEGLVL